MEDRQGHVSSARQSWSSTYCSTPEFLDNSYWRRQTVCCGVVYLGRLGEAMMDQRLYQPCTTDRKHNLTLSPTETPGSSSLQVSPASSSMPPASPSSSSAFSSSLTPSSIESLVEAELQAFQVFGSLFIIDSWPDSTDKSLDKETFSTSELIYFRAWRRWRRRRRSSTWTQKC